MKSVKFLFLGMMTLSFVLASCKKDDDATPVSYVEDGFYVVGEATAVADLLADNADMALMAVGINENDGHKTRIGMYEKYVALESGKTFSIIQKAGDKETKFGATMEKVSLIGKDDEGNDQAMDEQPLIEIFKGTLAENGTDFQVTTNGLYHVIVDVDLKTVIIAPADWGVRGDMNSWGFTDFPKPTFNKTEMTYTLTNVSVSKATGDFKFAYGGGWKLELNPDDTPLVKAETNLGYDANEALTPGGGNIPIERGKYTIVLKWTLAKGAVKDGFTATVTRTGDVELLYPETLYMIGEEFGNWTWSSEDVVEMIPVNGIEGAFWCIKYFTADKGFKWFPKKNWDDGFADLGEKIGFDEDNDNAVVADDGLYSVYINMAADKITIEPAKVFGKGNCFGGWAEGVNPLPFVLNADGDLLSLTTTTALDNKALRMYAGFTDPSVGWDWWKTEFIILDGKIVYRGNGGDQESVPVDAGKKITLDFKAGTGVIE